MINKHNGKKERERTAVVIPSYNEAVNIKKIIPLILSIFPHAYVVVVDDNSPDGTKNTVNAMRKKYKHLHMILRNKKGGRGSAVIEGLKYAYQNIDPDIFVEMDADLSHNPEEIIKMLKLSKKNTIVIASRYMKGGRIINVTLKRRILSYLANIMIKIILRNPIVDNTNGFRCYRKDAIRCLIKHKFISNSYIVLSESATVLNREGFKFIEFPSIFTNRVEGKSNATISEFKNSFLKLLSIKRQLSKL